MIYDAWIRTPILIDACCVMVLFLPVVSNNICSVAAGFFAAQGNDYLAGAFTNALYYLWAVYTGFLGCLVLYAGIRLLRLLQRHLIQKSDSHVDVGKVLLGALKVKIIIGTACACLFFFALILLLYAILRVPITHSTGYNLAICLCWTFNGVAATGLIEVAVLLKYVLCILSSYTNGNSALWLFTHVTRLF